MTRFGGGGPETLGSLKKDMGKAGSSMKGTARCRGPVCRDSALISPPGEDCLYKGPGAVTSWSSCSGCPPGLSSNCTQLDGFGKGLSFPTCKKQRGEHPACSMQEPNRGTGGRGHRTVHMLALEQRDPNNQKCHLSPGVAKRQEPPNLPPPHVTYGILNCRAHCGFVLEHRGHLQEGIDHLLWVRCVSLRT